ncbi:MAG: CBS domain-containing protein [Acidobacteriota bacterium]
MTLLAKDVMHRDLITAVPETRLYQALQMMVEKSIRHLPIVSNGALVGLISDRDLKRHMSVRFGSEQEKQEDRMLMLQTAADLMTTDVATVGPNVTLKDVVAQMIEKKFGAMPVVDDRGRPVGIITSIDLLKLLHERLE